MKSEKGLHIHLFSIHGLIRKNHLEMGRDADTGGQVKYVLEFAETLSKFDEVKQVDLFTRLIKDKTVSADYSRPIEKINDKANIIRIQCGGGKYLRKELLWPHLDEYIDKVVKRIKRTGQIPDLIHTHYADAGQVGMELSSMFGVPFFHTGHSLGITKLEKLIEDGMNHDEINKKYSIKHRIKIEEDILKQADIIVTSTSHEIHDQYEKYKNKDMSKFVILPPGVNLKHFHPFYSVSSLTDNDVEVDFREKITDELDRFFLDAKKPLILSICRPDKRKNLSGLITAYGKDKELQEMANLAIFAGIRKDINTKEENEREVLTEILLLLDRYDLYGKMAIPKRHDFEHEVPVLFRVAAAKRGVFVNPALIEPFGLSLIEATASGLPIVATNSGGPNDIISYCKNGILINASDTNEISSSIKKILKDKELWKKYSNLGVANVSKFYSWDAHGRNYLSIVKEFCKTYNKEEFNILDRKTYGKRLTTLKKLFVTDIDNTLLGDSKSLKELIKIIKDNRDKVGFGVATGRTAESAKDVLAENGICDVDIIISSVGTELYYGTGLAPDKGWRAHISNKWNRDKIKKILSGFKFLNIQEDETQKDFKLSYYMENNPDYLSKVHDILIKNKCRYNLIYSNDQFLDILPYRASKGKAIRYLSYKWEIPLERIYVCGDSGNDEEMLVGDTLGLVVGNYSQELEKLKGRKSIYFSDYDYAAGIVDGLKHYRFIAV